MATKKRVTRKATASETGDNGRTNGGDDNPGAITGAAPISGKTPAGGESDDVGDREAIPAKELDTVYTADSKDRWDSDQPSFQDQMKQKRANDDSVAKDQKKNG